MRIRYSQILLLLFLCITITTKGQFNDQFHTDHFVEWDYFSGDGNIELEFTVRNDFAKFIVDSRNDLYNVWWALLRKNITDEINISQLIKPEYEIRVEAKIKVNSAPRRINLHFNTNRTTDFHSHLMEYEIPDTSEWHIVSMTTKDFNVQPGDSVNVQLAMMDWGIGLYSIQIDYIKVDVVNKNETEKDFGNSVPYHPKIKSISEYSNHQAVSNLELVSEKFRNEYFNKVQYISNESIDSSIILTGDQFLIMNWDFDDEDQIIIEDGLLEVEVTAYQKGEFSLSELGQIRLAEILTNNIQFGSKGISYNDLIGGDKKSEIINPQPIFDLDLDGQKSNTKYFSISKYVLQRLFNKESDGLVIQALGPMVCKISNKSNNKIKLHYSVKQDK